MSRKLLLDDIADIRAYERERAAFRQRVIELKRRRRVEVGPYCTFLFENRDTIRFQIQEMARVERLYSDVQIETELRIYNPLIPEPGQLSATFFIELTSDALLREWLPKLIGIERAVRLYIGTQSIAFAPDSDHDEQLTRQDVTASVHYVHLALAPAQIAEFAKSGGTLAIEHPNYHYRVELSPETQQELLADLNEP